jgi:hypothetical protein
VVTAGPRQPSVCALVSGFAEVPEAGQAIRDPAGLREGVERALNTGAEWIWVLDGSSAPRPGSLAALLDAAGRAACFARPDVLVGVVLDAGGGVHESRPPWYRPDQIDIAMAATGQRLLPIRATAGPALVSRAAAEADLPAARAQLSPGGVLEWTAQILKFGTGYYVPDSESDAVAPLTDPVTDPRTAARLLFGRSFRRFDRVRLGYLLLERVSKPAL